MNLEAKGSPPINLVRTSLVLIWLLALAGNNLQAQVVKAQISITSLSPARVVVDGECALTDTWSFRNVYGGITGLGQRIDNFQATDAQGESVSVRQLAPGEFRANSRAAQFKYEVAVGEPAKPAQLSHLSWLNQERGFLMLADLLPHSGNASEDQLTVVEFKLPNGWTVLSAVRPAAGQRYLVPKTKDAVFYVGRSLREKTVDVDSMELALITSSEWPFKDSEALNVAGQVIKHYSKLTKHRLPSRLVVMLSPLTSSDSQARWSAETRGSTIVLLVRANTSRGVLLDRLGILFTHELLHLWVPNALSLDGDYDWFFEGFTVYQALLTALKLNFITFQDYLRTIARVYDSYRALPERNRLSLIEASERRWTSSPSFVYDRGMLVAFIYDLTLRQVSGHKASVEDVYSQLFRRAVVKRENGNEVIMSILNSSPGMSEFAEQYVKSPRDIDLRTLLAPYGLMVHTADSQTRIVVEKELNAGQRSLLQKLGFTP
jgi:predicted metalloprotease with PDZ domain